MTDRDWTIDTVSWAEARDLLLAIRFEIFVHEQGVPAEMEEDADDPQALHLLVRTVPGGDPIATARLLPNGHIGRMAVRRQWRGRGIGSAMLAQLLSKARRKGLESVFLNAQCAAEAFYRRQGFRPEGAIFEDAGIPHRRMWRPLR
ncbi:MAG: GNAT family N-acetyltransferase [Gammaproteobacteria bacterium]|nr:MAG: GNAT family N-acetyltransferase [Gammaproteobacteria bacterium]